MQLIDKPRTKLGRGKKNSVQLHCTVCNNFRIILHWTDSRFNNVVVKNLSDLAGGHINPFKSVWQPHLYVQGGTKEVRKKLVIAFNLDRNKRPFIFF
jgi:hypothetical protein